MLNPCHKCDWKTKMTTDKKIIADFNNDYCTELQLLYLYIIIMLEIDSHGSNDSLQTKWVMFPCTHLLPDVLWK